MKNTIQKSIVFNKSEYNKILHSYNSITRLDSVRDITLHKYLRLVIQIGIDNLMIDMKIRQEAGLV